MTDLKIMSLNGEDMINLIPKSLRIPSKNSEHYWRAQLLVAMIEKVNADIIGLVEAPPNEKRTRKFVDSYFGGRYEVYQGEKRGTLGLAFLVKASLGIKVRVQAKADSN